MPLLHDTFLPHAGGSPFGQLGILLEALRGLVEEKEVAGITWNRLMIPVSLCSDVMTSGFINHLHQGGFAASNQPSSCGLQDRELQTDWKGWKDQKRMDMIHCPCSP